MRGKRGTRTVLSIVRESSENPIDIPIVRGNVKVRSVKYTDLDEGYAYVRITSFIENTVIDLEKALNSHQKKYGKVSGLILDLRRNPGGLLDQAVRMSDLFIEDGVIVSTIGRDAEKKEVTRATKRAPFKDFPVIVLVNEYSASASEIVAGALQDNKRAIILGQKTFGKGSVQSVIKLSDGSGLKLTVARYFTPSGRSIQAEGISPDIELQELNAETFKNSLVKERATREKDIQGHLLSDKEKADKAKSQESIDAWWKTASEAKPGKLSPKDQLLTSDYLAFQAFNYVKAFKLMKDIQNKSTQ
jgi:carboxyl-terminal processing protease